MKPPKKVSEIDNIIAEAEEDLEDARVLSKRGAVMGLYHASQAAEKFIRAVALAFDRRVQITWDLSKVYAAVADLEGMDQVADAVGVLSEFTTPPKTKGGDVTVGLPAARTVRAVCLKLLGRNVSSEPGKDSEDAVEDIALAPEQPHEPPPRPMSSRQPGPYVKAMLMCQTCGVRIPRTRQTAHGATCPHCGRSMVLVRV